jgi:hypothetical protein
MVKLHGDREADVESAACRMVTAKPIRGVMFSVIMSTYGNSSFEHLARSSQPSLTHTQCTNFILNSLFGNVTRIAISF